MIERLTDPQRVKYYIEHPQIWEAVAEDGVAFEEFTPTIGPDDHFVVTGVEAMFYLHPVFNSGVWQIHAHVHPDHREGAPEAARLALDYAFTNLSALKVVAVIPSLFPRVRGFALKCGLKSEGCITQSYPKHGALHDQWLLGITRAEFFEGQ